MTPHGRAVLVAQLWATRASVDAALTALGAFDDADGPGESDSGVCMHPIDEREDLTTMGGPDGWRCRVCGFSTLPTGAPEAPEAPTAPTAPSNTSPITES